jgi:hypothetical protein
MKVLRNVFKMANGVMKLTGIAEIMNGHISIKKDASAGYNSFVLSNYFHQ